MRIRRRVTTPTRFGGLRHPRIIGLLLGSVLSFGGCTGPSPEVSDENLTILLVTHDPMEPMTLCTSAIVLEAGRVVESGRLEDLLPDPRSEMLKVFRDHGHSAYQERPGDPTER